MYIVCLHSLKWLVKVRMQYVGICYTPTETPRVPYIAQVMNDAPAVAATDYMKLFAEQVRAFIPAQKLSRIRY